VLELGLWKRLQGDGIGAVVARGASGSFIIMVISTLLVFGVNVILARLLGVKQFGIYTYVLAWINILLLFPKAGMEGTIVRFVSAYKVKKEWGLLRGFFTYSFKLVFLLSLLVGTLSMLVLWFIDNRIDHDLATTFLVAFLLLPVLSLTAIRNAGLRAFKLVVKSGVDGIVRPLVIGLLAVGYYFYFQENIQAFQVMSFSLAGALVAFFIGTVWLLKALPEQLHDHDPVYKRKEWLKVSVPLFLMSGMHIVLHQTDSIMIGLLLDTDRVGIYVIATRIASLVGFGLLAANSIVAPLIAELWSTDNHDELQRIVTLAVRGIFVFTIICSSTLVVFGEMVLGLFGEEFISGYMPLLLLILGQMINALAGPVGFLMTMTGHQKQAAVILGMSVLVNIVLNVILIPQMGVVGAAIATVTATLILNVSLLIFVMRNLKINPTILA